MNKLLNHIKNTLSTQILLGLFLGVFVGLFLGEAASSFSFIGDIFLRCFQMPVIPYIIVSIIGSLGRLNYKDAKSIFLNGGIVLLIFWGITIFAVLLFPLGFPSWKSSAFFSNSLLAEGKSLSLIELFIPLNPFHSMANTIIPAVVFFCIAIGLALITIDQKQGLLNALDTMTDALMKVTRYIAKLTPFGVFAIVANAAGTLPLEAFQRLGVYIVLQAAMALILCFWVVPGLIAILTPLKYKDVVSAYRTPLITAFAAANILIVLPLIISRSRDLLLQLEPSPDQNTLSIDAPLEVLVPVSLTFPSIGKLLSLAFIPFAGWYSGNSVPFSQYPTFLFGGLASLFGDSISTMRFLLNLLGIPTDMLQIYITLEQVSASRFGVMVSGMSTIGLALIATCSINGLITIRKRKIIRFSVVSVLSLLLTVGAIHAFFTYAVASNYQQDKKLAQLQLLRVRNPSQSVRILEGVSELEVDPTFEGSRLQQIENRRTIRACFISKSYPLSYFNDQNPPELVGFNIEMAHILAQDLGVGIEFIPISPDFENQTFLQTADLLNQGYCDVDISSLPITPKLAAIMQLSTSFENYTLAFLVKDSDRDSYSQWTTLTDLSDLRIGISGDIDYYQAKLKGLLPNAKLVPIQSIESFLKGEDDSIDAIVTVAEIGSAWTLLYPDYSIAIPKPIVAVPMAYGLPKGASDLTNVVNAWLQLKQQDGTIQSLYNYWVQGQTESIDPPRWSILGDVLGWGR